MDKFKEEIGILCTKPIYITDSVLITPIYIFDSNKIYSILKNNEIQKNLLTLPYPYTMDDAIYWTNYCEKERKKNKICTNFAIRKNGDFIGSISLHPSNILQIDFKNEEKWEIGYYLDSQYSGQGIMTKCIQIITQKVAFDELKLNAVWATPFIFNLASHRVLEKSGYIFLEEKKDFHIKNNNKLDAKIYISKRSK
jgi:RimJ/RimL family protein N-acetyltransferase